MTYEVAIVAEGDGWIAANKPHGCPVQSTPSRPDSLQSRLSRSRSSAEPYLTPVHRIDRATSGIVLFATTKRSARLLSQQFASGKVEKLYRAKLRGHLEAVASTIENHDRESLVNNPLEALDGNGNRTGVVWEDRIEKLAGSPKAAIVPPSDSTRGKHCLTEVLAGSCGEGFTDVLLRPRTGRMHQIRVQAASRNHPVLGDSLYDSNTVDPAAATTDLSRDPKGATLPSPDRIELMAIGLGFFDPRTGRPVRLALDPKTGEPAVS